MTTKYYISWTTALILAGELLLGGEARLTSLLTSSLRGRTTSQAFGELVSLPRYNGLDIDFIGAKDALSFIPLEIHSYSPLIGMTMCLAALMGK